MSDTAQGPDWWQGTDGKWYPPMAAAPTSPPAPVGSYPSGPPLPGPPPPKSPWNAKSIGCLGAVAAVFLLAIVSVAAITLLGKNASSKFASVESAVSSSAPSGPTTAPATTSRVPPTTKAPVTTTTAAPTTTTTRAPFPKTPFAGTGDFVIKLPAVISDPVLVTMTHGGSSNFQVTALDAAGDRQGSLANEIGIYQGTKPANFSVGETLAMIQVKADGPWTIILDDITTAPLAKTGPGERTDGIGDSVVLFRAPALASIQFSCPGCTSNVQLTAYGDRRESLVNEIDAYTGTVIIPKGTVLLQIVTSDQHNPGAWSITVT